MIFWVAEIIDLQGPREILEGAGGPRGPKSILRIWQDLARPGRIWQDLAGSGPRIRDNSFPADPPCPQTPKPPNHQGIGELNLFSHARPLKGSADIQHYFIIILRPSLFSCFLADLCVAARVWTGTGGSREPPIPISWARQV